MKALGVLLLGAALNSCAPVGAGGGESLRIAVISDLNSSYGSTEYDPAVHSAVAMIRDEWRPDLVLIAGDMIAAQRPSLTDDNVRAMWEAFEEVVGRPLREAGIPFAFTVGNHDASAYPAYARDRRLALEHWGDPARDTGVDLADAGEFPLYYSFVAGETFVLVWDAGTEDTFQNRQMMEWVQAELTSDAAANASVRILLGHLPLYAVAEGRDRSGEVLARADSLQALLQSHHVDVYLSGHHHAFYPGRRGDLDLLFSGALGQGARQLLGSHAEPIQTVTMLDIAEGSELIEYTTYAYTPGTADGWMPLDIRTLPRRIGDVLRRDLARR